MHTQFWPEKQKGKTFGVSRYGILGNVILKWILNSQDITKWNAFIWLVT
jgi:hypothetical protein